MRRALVMAHYDQDGVVDPYVIEALRRYRAVVDRLVLVSSSADRLPAELDGLVDDSVIRRNEGYDFCSWRAGIETLEPRDRYDELVCVNDSVYGPLADLMPALNWGFGLLTSPRRPFWDCRCEWHALTSFP